jgi:hypothetical protein
MESVELIFLNFQLEKFLTLSNIWRTTSSCTSSRRPSCPPTFELEESDASELCRRMLEMNSGNYGNKLKMVKIKVLLAELFARFFIDELQMLNDAARRNG